MTIADAINNSLFFDFKTCLKKEKRPVLVMHKKTN